MSLATEPESDTYVDPGTDDVEMEMEGVAAPAPAQAPATVSRQVIPPDGPIPGQQIANWVFDVADAPPDTVPLPAIAFCLGLSEPIECFTRTTREESIEQNKWTMAEVPPYSAHQPHYLLLARWEDEKECSTRAHLKWTRGIAPYTTANMLGRVWNALNGYDVWWKFIDRGYESIEDSLRVWWNGLYHVGDDPEYRTSGLQHESGIRAHPLIGHPDSALSLRECEVAYTHTHYIGPADISGDDNFQAHDGGDDDVAVCWLSSRPGYICVPIIPCGTITADVLHSAAREYRPLPRSGGCVYDDFERHADLPRMHEYDMKRYVL
jgi:hypothetical protein